jgi:hypothetical protein
MILCSIDDLGILSGIEQNLNGPITSIDKLKASNHSLFISINEDGRVSGYIKVGLKKLFFYVSTFNSVWIMCVTSFTHVLFLLILFLLLQNLLILIHVCMSMFFCGSFSAQVILLKLQPLSNNTGFNDMQYNMIYCCVVDIQRKNSGNGKCSGVFRFLCAPWLPTRGARQGLIWLYAQGSEQPSYLLLTLCSKLFLHHHVYVYPFWSHISLCARIYMSFFRHYQKKLLILRTIDHPPS